MHLCQVKCFTILEKPLTLCYHHRRIIVNDSECQYRTPWLSNMFKSWPAGQPLKSLLLLLNNSKRHLFQCRKEYLLSFCHTITVILLFMCWVCCSRQKAIAVMGQWSKRLNSAHSVMLLMRSILHWSCVGFVLTYEVLPVSAFSLKTKTAQVCWSNIYS